MVADIERLPFFKISGSAPVIRYFTNRSSFLRKFFGMMADVSLVKEAIVIMFKKNGGFQDQCK